MKLPLLGVLEPPHLLQTTLQNALSLYCLLFFSLLWSCDCPFLLEMLRVEFYILPLGSQTQQPKIYTGELVTTDMPRGPLLTQRY